MEYRFDVYGRIVIVVRTAAGEWIPHFQGADGKRQRADFAISPRIGEGQLALYLEEIFHEWATPERPEVIRLPEEQ